ncbi:hypothetical protein TELCIR_13132 [Teladorsagia circumcincta]|uniref:Uncharacterized protein n=1 Tax=Teladorsagia circumcincta TaxID=45464 RepID=A0A2G9U685_TELCI|nr:hypothetical protein TELCIR_13132 [Teladorsagia circumcincta]
MVKEHIWRSIHQGERLSRTLGLKRPLVIREGLAKTSIHPNMILLTFTFLHMGLLVSFFLGIYPTTLSFTASLAKDVYIVALYSCSAGLAEVFVRRVVHCAIPVAIYDCDNLDDSALDESGDRLHMFRDSDQKDEYIR